MRTRQEIRSLSEEQWARVVKALWIMKTTREREGRLKYGDGYLSYDSMVMKHALAAMDPTGDSAHFGPHFFLFHRCWLMQIENVLILIDSKIDGLPYWDYRIDMSEGFSSDSPRSAFNDAYLGKLAGKKPRFEVTNGRFRLWPVTKVVGNDFGESVFPVNRYGYLRHPLSINNSPFLTRNAFTICGNHFSFNDWGAWDECLVNPTTIDDYFVCVDRRIHAPPHLIGGSWRRRKQMNANTCSQWFGFVAPPSPHQPQGAYIHPFAKGCFKCPALCSQDDPPDKLHITSLTHITLHLPSQPYECARCICTPKHINSTCGPLFTGLVDFNSSTAQIISSGGNAQIKLTCQEAIQVTGDMMDAVASPNDPLFIFHHSNIDRHFSLWMEYRNSLQSSSATNYYNFPTKNPCRGCNLADIISEISPFERSLFAKDVLPEPVPSRILASGTASLRQRVIVSVGDSPFPLQDDDYYGYSIQPSTDDTAANDTHSGYTSSRATHDSDPLTIREVFDLTAKASPYYRYESSPDATLRRKSSVRRGVIGSENVSLLRDVSHEPRRISINTHSSLGTMESVEFMGYAKGTAIALVIFLFVSLFAICACVVGAAVRYVTLEIRRKNSVSAAPTDVPAQHGVDVAAAPLAPT